VTDEAAVQDKFDQAYWGERSNSRLRIIRTIPLRRQWFEGYRTYRTYIVLSLFAMLAPRLFSL